MSKQTFKQLQELSKERLQEMLLAEQNKTRQLRFKAGQGELKQVHQVKEAKHLIARIITALTGKKN